MKKSILVLLFTFIVSSIYSQSTIITPGGDSQNIQISGAKNGLKISGLSTLERDAIINPTKGYTIFNTTTNCLEVFNGSYWFNMCEPNQKPSATYTFNTSALQVNFTNNSQKGISYLWDFGNGQTSTQANPTITYATAGNYTVLLKVTNNFGESAFSQVVSVSQNLNPIANFTYVISGKEVTFTNTSQNALSYLWNFGNGQTSILSNPTTGYTNYGTFTVQLEVINGLGSNTISKTITLSDIAPNTVTDIDGNIYNTITIGSQLWMKENLNVQRFKNGEAIPNVTDASTWANTTTAAWCRVNNNPDASNAFKVGLLYNGYVAQDARGVCPNGWKVPDDSDFNKLVEYLGASSIAGGKLKEANGIYSLWNSPNTGATNESGFTALPGGWRVGKTGIYTEGNFTDWGYGCRLWTKSNSFAGGVYLLDVYYVNTSTNRGSQIQSYGSSIRCIKE
jgi:uncharacterized protein (TIGR02145 family)